MAAFFCSMALFLTGGLYGSSEAVCISPAEAEAMGMGHAFGWYDGYEDRLYVQEGLSFYYSMEVVAHEAAHAHDLRLGTRVNGYPSFFSETHTGFDVEEYARMVTFVSGWWPRDEVFPDVVPSSEDYWAMHLAGWLPSWAMESVS